jgi:hypothetical protein
MKSKLILILLLLFYWGQAMSDDTEKYWNEVYDTRYKYIEANFGSLPNDILKIMHLSGAWPGGGLYKFKADKLGSDLWVYMTFGLTNPDMPTTVIPRSIEIKQDSGRPGSTSLTLGKKQNVPSYTGRNGYGYELMVVTKGEKQWPLWLLQWAVEAELIKDADLLGRVEKYNGLVVEDIGVGGDGVINVLFQKADAPFPKDIVLPKGSSPIIIATVITDDEMKWSDTNGRDKLLAALKGANVAQLSDISRVSIFHPNGVDFVSINTRDKASSLHKLGLLRKAYLFPLEFGGQDTDANTIYIPKNAMIEKLRFEKQVMQLAQKGLLENYNATPEYKGDSVVPAKLLLQATGKQSIKLEINVF